MRGHRWLAASLILLGTGCHSNPSTRSLASASAEPALLPPTEPGTTIVQTQPARELTWADRHPLFHKPREYYDNSGGNKAVKVATATVIGVPAGIIGELKQIVTGSRPETQTPY